MARLSDARPVAQAATQLGTLGTRMLQTRPMMRRVGTTGAAVALAVTALAAPAQAATPPDSASIGNASADTSIGFLLDRGRLTKIDLPGDGSFTVLSKINNRGKIVGKTPDKDGVGYDGLVGDRWKLRRFDAPGSPTTYAQGIDDRGRIVGDASPGSAVGDAGATGYLLVGGRYRRIAYPGAVFTQAFGINTRGQVVGEYLDRRGVYHGYRWENGRFTRFDGPQGSGASITDINDRGDMVGAYPIDPANPSAGLRGFLLRNGKYTTFSALNSLGTIPFDINNRGQVAGTAIMDPQFTDVHGFVYARGVDRPATQIDGPGTTVTSVYGLDDRGRLLGVYANPDAAPAAQRLGAGALPNETMPMRFGQQGGSR
jgi:probable HAF family extracellular repeat protein